MARRLDDFDPITRDSASALFTKLPLLFSLPLYASPAD